MAVFTDEHSEWKHTAPANGGRPSRGIFLAEGEHDKAVETESEAVRRRFVLVGGNPLVQEYPLLIRLRTPIAGRCYRPGK